jgi:crotonobetainyl-CoA:carnitine CoA-transferase CaiB-like acyl-CoA transferase
LTGDRFLTTQQALDHEQVVHNGTVLPVADPVLGPSLQLGPLVRFEASPSLPGSAAPVLDGGRAVVRERVPVASGRPSAPAPSTSGPGPLAGLMILDFASWLAGPFGTSLLADMGARVIKIEPPQGDDARWALDGRARTFQGKESLALDLKTPEGAEVVARLLARADGLMHNMRGDASARLGIDYEKASAINPSIVYLYAGSYGSTGPGAGRAAFHPMMGALSGGVMRQLGRGNEPPSADVELDAEQLMRQSLALSRANETSPDITGALGVATAMSLALLHRQRTGHGQYVETTMLASNLYICSEDAIRFDGQPPLPLVDADLRGTSALNRLYRTADGWLFLSCPTDVEWNRFAAAAGHPQWVDDPRFAESATRARFDDQLVAEIAIALGARSADEWEKRLVSAQVAGVRADAGAGEDFFLSDPHSIENGFVVLGQHSGVGRYRRAGVAAHFARTPGAANVSHAFGQDGPAILAELGYDQATIDRWRESKILIT